MKEVSGDRGTFNDVTQPSSRASVMELKIKY